MRKPKVEQPLQEGPKINWQEFRSQRKSRREEIQRRVDKKIKELIESN